MKKFLTGILAVVLSTLMFFGVNASPVHAEETDDEIDENNSSLRISPTGIRFSLEEGTVLEGSADGCKVGKNTECVIEITNPSNKTLDYKVYITPYVVSGSENELSFVESDNDATHTQISRWIDFKNADGEWVKEATFSIAPKETKRLEYRVTVPNSIPGGSQYAVIWAQLLEGETAGGIQTVGQVGSIISGRSRTNSIESIEISNFEMTRFTLDNKLYAAADVKNTGNTDVLVTYTYAAKTFFGKEIHRDEQTLAAYPETDYHVEINWNEAPMLGIFQVDFTVQGANMDPITERHVVVILPVILFILVILLLTVIIAWIIIIIRKRKERKARKLV